MDKILIYIVTAFGFLLSTLCFVVIFRGKRIPGDSGSSQELEYKGFKMKTNGVVFLLLVSAVVTVLPIGLQAWLQSLQLRNPPRAPSQQLVLFITGQVLDGSGPMEGAKVSVVNMKNVKPGDDESPIVERVTKNSGTFDFPALPFDEGDRYKIVASKEGHVEQSFYMGPSGAVDMKTVLVAKRTSGSIQ